MMPEIPFIDVKAQRTRLKDKIDAAIARVLDHGQFILGPEVGLLEQRLAAFSGTRHAITCANGTDALTLVLMAEGIGPGDAVFVPAFTFVATAESVRLVGATPVFCDVLEHSFTLDPISLDQAIDHAKSLGLKPRMVIPVDLFGQTADYRRILPIAQAHDVVVLADGAQSFGASLDGKKVGQFGKAATTSFFPAKPLGCFGDGGAILTDDDALAERLRSLRFHGKGSDKYDNVRVGLNSRLDTLQAAILLEKLDIFADEITARQRAAHYYSTGLAGSCRTPAVIEGAASVWAQYTLIVEDRENFAMRLKEAGVPTAIYYPIPLSRQTGYRDCPLAPKGVPVSEWLAGHVLSLPMHPYLTEQTQDYIIRAITQKR